VSAKTAWLWRRALGVEGWTGTEGMRRLVQANAEKMADALRGKPLPPEQVEIRRRNARKNNNAQYLDPARGRGWTAGQLALLGVHPDSRVAALIGRSEGAVLQKREEVGIPNPESPAWQPEELELLGALPDAEVAARTGRTQGAVTAKRCQLGIRNATGWGWSAEQLALLGTAPDEEVAARTGKTPAAVTRKRCLLGIPTFRDRRKADGRRR
jgi:hypothetical protein